jgi:hypothetical protein
MQTHAHIPGTISATRHTLTRGKDGVAFYGFKAGPQKKDVKGRIKTYVKK